MKMKTPVFIFGIVIIIVALFLLWSTEENNVAKVPISPTATTTEEIATDTEIIKLIEADIASTEPRTLEISGWKKLSDQPNLDFIGDSIEIWFPEEWFTNISYDSGHGSAVPVYRWPDFLEKTDKNFDLLRPYLLDLIVGRIDFKNNFSGSSSIVPNTNIGGYPVELNIGSSIRFNEPQKYKSGVSVEISIILYYDEYTNSQEIFNEIVNRIEITEIKK